jgi:predicted transposase YdaD
MAKKFDATLKTLLEESPQDWPALAGQPPRPVKVIDADISTISGATDKVLLVRGPPDSIMHFDFQAGPDARASKVN